MLSRAGMKTRLSLALVLVSLLLLAPGLGHAADVRVSYLADLKTLKSGAPAGTPLTFQIFADGSCATPVASQIVNVEAVSLLEQVKAVTVRGGLRAPKPVELRHVMTGVPPLPTLYLKVTGAGIAAVGGDCQLQNATVGSMTAPPSPTCPPDSVRAGTPCVDKYEASLWDIPAGNIALIQKVKDGTATLADLMGGGATEISVAATCLPAIPATFRSDGNYSAPLYAASIPGVVPTACVSVFQADAACELSGKRLLTNAEWIAAATGTPGNYVNDNNATDCNTDAGGSGTGTPVNTGSRSSCVSTAGIYDAVGNVDEWTTGTFSTTWVRGGFWADGPDAAVSLAAHGDPSTQTYHVGFRCGR